MRTNKPVSVGAVAAACWVGLVLVDRIAGPAKAVEPVRSIAPPHLTSDDQARLIRWIRAVLADPEGTASPGGELARFQRIRCPIYLTLRRGAYVVAAGRSDGGQGLLEGCRAAARSALKLHRLRERPDAKLLAKLAIEVELLGPVQQLPMGLLARRSLLRQYKPGIDGVALRLGGAGALLRPSQIISMGLDVAGALEHLREELGIKPDASPNELERVACLRFRTTHFWQPRTPSGQSESATRPVKDGKPLPEVVELVSGCRLVDVDEVTAARLDQEIERLARYLRARQRPDGLFSAAYFPWSDTWEETNTGYGLAATARALAMHGRLCKSAESTRAARKTIDLLCDNLVPMDDAKRDAGDDAATGAYLAAPGQGQRIGATAMLLLAVDELQEDAGLDRVRKRLLRALLSRQLPTGMLDGNFVTTRAAAPQDVDPGQALLALAREYERDWDEALRSVLTNALGHYRKHLEVKPSAALAGWLGQAYASSSLVGEHREAAELVFQAVDWLGKHQLTRRNCRYAIMRGGIDPNNRDLAGVSTALHLAAIADAHYLAKDLMDAERVQRYREMLLHGTRFVLQLIFRPEECTYPRSRFDTVGGVRTAPWNHTLATENAHLALVALLKARRELFE